MISEAIDLPVPTKKHHLSNSILGEQAFDLLCETAARDHGYRRNHLWINLRSDHRGDGVVAFDDTDGREVASVMLDHKSVVMYINGNSDYYSNESCSFGLVSSKQEKRVRRLANSNWYQRNVSKLKESYLRFHEIGPEGRTWSGLDVDIRFRLEEATNEADLKELRSILGTSDISGIAHAIEDIVDTEMALEQVSQMRSFDGYADGVSVARQWISARGIEYRAQLTMTLRSIADSMWVKQFSPDVDAMACMKWDAVRALN